MSNMQVHLAICICINILNIPQHGDAAFPQQKCAYTTILPPANRPVALDQANPMC